MVGTAPGRITRLMLSLLMAGGLTLTGCTLIGGEQGAAMREGTAEQPPEDIARLFDSGHDGDLEQGRSAYRDEDFYRALHELYPLAVEGNAEAQRTLGVIFARGQGVPANAVTARYWLERAAEQADVEAQRLLGRYHHEGRYLERDTQAASHWFSRAAANGDADAQFYLSNLYQLGQGVAQNDESAFRWMKAAAEQGHLAARNNLGWMYLHGKGISPDLEKAEAWYLGAAGAGLPSAQYNLSRFYGEAPHPFNDPGKSRAWLRQAGASGHAGALRRILQEPSIDVESAETVVLFGVPLSRVDRQLMRQRIEQAGGIPLTEKNDRWYDVFEAGDLLAGADRLFVGYSLRNATPAELRYRLPGENTPGGVARVRDLLEEKYGAFQAGSELHEFEGVHARREVRGVTIELRRSWPDDALELRYVLPEELAYLREEQQQNAPSAAGRPELDTY